MPGGRAGGGGGHASGGGGGRISGGGGSFRGSSGSSFGGRSGGGSFYPSAGSRPVRDYAPSWNQHYNVPKAARTRPKTIYVGPVIHAGPVVTHTTSGSSRPPAGGSTGGSGSSGGSGCGCGVVLIVVLLLGLFLLFAASFGGNSGSAGGVANSTVQRQALSAGAVNLTDYYADNARIINSTATLQSGMKHFYEQTGVQPFLYTTDSIDGNYDPTNAQLESYAQQLYSELFTDDAHFLVIIYDADYDGFGYYYIPGTAAKAVLDSEALDIFEGYVNADFDQYYSGTASYFSNVFSDTADRIMQVTRSSSFYLGIALVIVAILGLAYYWWKKAKEKRLKELEMTQQILDADVNDIAKDPTLEDLEKKYSD